MDFLTEENHWIRFTASLRMPKHTEFLFFLQTDFTQFVELFLMLNVFDSFVNANKLMVSGNEFYHFAQWIIEQNEVLE